MNSSIREKLDHLIHEDVNEDYNSISALIGKNHAYIQQFIKRGIPKTLRDDDLKIIAAHFSVPLVYFNDPSGFNESSPQYRGEDKILSIPYYDIGASAGAGSYIDGENPIGTLPFSVDQLNVLGIKNFDRLAVLKVRGDSMLPSLNDGDDILVSSELPRSVKDGIYVIRLDDSLMVKRISVNPVNKLFTIRSDNTIYESWENCPPESVSIIGRVVWAGRRL